MADLTKVLQLFLFFSNVLFCHSQSPSIELHFLQMFHIKRLQGKVIMHFELWGGFTYQAGSGNMSENYNSMNELYGWIFIEAYKFIPTFLEQSLYGTRH